MVRSQSPRVLGALFAVLALALSTACTREANASWRGGSGVPSGDSSSNPAGAGVVTIAPVGGTAAASVRDPVTVTAEGATLQSVTLTNVAGKQVAGEFDAERHGWHSTEPLGYGKAYSVAATATTAKGDQVTQTSQFTTVKPAKLAMPYLRANLMNLLGTGKTYGVGQPIVVWFDRPVADKAAAESSLEVVTYPPVKGSWHWFDKQELHWRPPQYWKPGTKVTVNAKVYGVKLGDGLYGEADRSASFTIGRSKIAIADSNTKHMIVYFDGVVVRDIPVSMGKGGIVQGVKGPVNYWTNSGPHVIMNKEPVVRMTSASNGIVDPEDPNFYDELVKLALRITYSGEFVHLADWNIPAHGHRNTSHGCVNVGPANAQWFYENFGLGDIVDVKNTPRQLDPRNGLGDWMLSWADWVKGSALHG
jgi:lipoprotein-anchoring transpeptidase ErfK/SrfK